jgi:hypothetical protein
MTENDAETLAAAIADFVDAKIDEHVATSDEHSDVDSRAGFYANTRWNDLVKALRKVQLSDDAKPEIRIKRDRRRK